MMRLQYFLLAASVFPISLADVRVTSPTAGSTISSTSIYVSFDESGNSPLLGQLSNCEVMLCAGGNDISDFIPIAPLTTVLAPAAYTETETSFYIDPTLGGNEPNAYFIKFTCAVSSGGTITDFSDRFSLTSMTGVFPSNIQQALNTVTGSSGPGTVDNYVHPAGTDSGSSSRKPSAAHTTIVSKSQVTPASTIVAQTQSSLYPATTNSVEVVTVTHSAQQSSLAASSTSSPITHSRNRHSLSSGAKAAIGICVTIAIVALVAGAAFYIRRRRRRIVAKHRESQTQLRMEELHQDFPGYASPIFRYINNSMISLSGTSSSLKSPPLVYGAKFPLPAELNDPAFYEGRHSGQGWHQRAELEQRDVVLVADCHPSGRGSAASYR